MAELKYWIWLAEKRGISLPNRYALIDYFGSPEKVYFTRGDDLKKFDFDCSPILDKSMAPVNKIIGDCEENYIDIITCADGVYPHRLKQIYDPPMVLYVKGRLPLIDEEAAITVVGTRACTSYGVMMSERFGYEIARGGGLVITGLARGIDSAAAKGALRAGGKVIGVLGNGIDIVYPKFNEDLYESVIHCGCLISEFPPGTPPEGKNFPIRNRIMSGLAVGVLVIEAPELSGALITARRAVDQGRDVFVLPGSPDSRASIGSNNLIREGATPVFEGKDVLEEYLLKFPQKLGRPKKIYELDDYGKKRLLDEELPEKDETNKNKHKPEKKAVDKPDSVDYIEISVAPEELNPEETAIIKSMTEPNIHIDTIIERTGLPAEDVMAAMTMMELSGYVTQNAGKRYTAHIKIS